jgi:hypothetical protein
MPGLTLDQLIFKGTHNSYADRARRAPWMNHSPAKQIDDFGVWALELDYSLQHDEGGPVAVVGHDRGGAPSGWGYTLKDYIKQVLATKSIAYRPVFLGLEVKRWKRSVFRPWRRKEDWEFTWQEKWEAGLAVLREVRGERFVILEDWLREHDYQWPHPLDLAGKLVLYEPGKRDGSGRLVGMQGTWASHVVTAGEVERAIETGAPFERGAWPCEGGARVLRLDQYQADWTFDYGVPPNPIVVDATAPESTLVDDAEGRRWRQGAESSHGQRVGRHGTWRFPYRSLAEAVERARGATSLTGGHPDPRRAGAGWTVLLRPASHHEAGTPIDFPLRIVKAEA